MNRGALREELARRLGAWIAKGIILASPTPTSTAFAATELTGMSPSEIVGKALAITSGTQLASERIVASLDNSNWTLTLRYALAAAPAATDLFEIYSAYSYARLNQAITNAVNSARKIFLVPKYDRSLVLVASTYGYTMPAGFNYLSVINLEHYTGRFDKSIGNDDWEVVDVSGVKTLKIRRYWITVYAGKKLELVGQAYPTAPALDATANPIPDEYVLAWACYNLSAEKPLGQVEQGWREKMGAWKDSFMEIAKKERIPALPGAKRVP